MKKELTETKDKPSNYPVVITDECGDSMWDAVLQQEVKACDIKAVSKNASSLLNRMDAVQVPTQVKRLDADD